jgi:hypothetical protein
MFKLLFEIALIHDQLGFIHRLKIYALFIQMIGENDTILFTGAIVVVIIW